jgi:mannose-6-phosphate isomerase-like protein (cupin superfamily)
VKVVRGVPIEQVSEQLSVKRMSDELGAEKLRANVWTLAEGSMLRHMHREQEELYLVLDGSMALTVEETTYKLDERDTLVVPPGVMRQAANCGWGPLTFLAIGAPGVDSDGELA